MTLKSIEKKLKEFRQQLADLTAKDIHDKSDKYQMIQYKIRRYEYLKTNPK